jgi:hypothetical protein
LDELLKYLDTRGVREKNLHENLARKYPKITAAMNKRAIEVKYQINENSFRRSTRISTTAATSNSNNNNSNVKGDGPSFLSYVNKLAK